MRHIIFLASWATRIVRGESENYCPANDLWSANGVTWRNLRDTGQPNVMPEPNICAFECDAVDAAGVALLEAGPNDYAILIDEAAASVGLGVLAKVAAGKDKNEKPTKAEKDALRDWTKSKGLKHADAVVVTKNDDTNATREQITASLVTYCNALPKRQRANK